MRMEVLRFSNNLYFLREVQTFFTVSGFFCPVDILKYLAYTKSADRDAVYLHNRINVYATCNVVGRRARHEAVIIPYHI